MVSVVYDMYFLTGCFDSISFTFSHVQFMSSLFGEDMGIFTLTKEERAQYSPGSENQRNPPVNAPNPSLGTHEDMPQPRWTPKAQHATVGGWEEKDFRGRFLPSEPKAPWLHSLFGSGHIEPGLHPCVHQAAVLHQCLDKNDDNISFCRPAWNILLGCTREYSQYDAKPWYNSFLPWKPFIFDTARDVRPNGFI